MTELVVTADEMFAERPCEETVEVVRIPLCFVGVPVLVSERDKVLPNVGPPLPPPGKPTRDNALRRPLPSLLPLISSETPVISSTGTTLLAEVEDIRRDRLRSRVTSRSSDRFPSAVN